jgi:hypothetical protein
MNGQWLGEFSGSNKGRIILNIDDLTEGAPEIRTV